MAHFINERKDIPAYVNQTLDHIRNRMHHPLTEFLTDNAKEYTSSTIQAVYRHHQVQHHLRAPHQPQENSIAERFNRTILNAVRSLPDTAGLHDTYWEDPGRHAIFKYNLMHHTAIDTFPYAKWYGRILAIQKFLIFGQLGSIPKYAPKKKLEERGDPARYMYAKPLTHVVVLNLRNQQYQTIRVCDFHPYSNETDPTYRSNMAYKTRSLQRKRIPEIIRIDTPHPANLRQARD